MEQRKLDMEEFIRLSLETNLFFARIMKEHSLFLQAGFVCKDASWIRRADFFRMQFEDLLRQTVILSNRMVGGCVLKSDELTTSFTRSAEQGTSRLSGIPIDSSITGMEGRLEAGRIDRDSKETYRKVRKLNERAMWLLDGLIEFKESILREVGRCRLFTLNYTLLIEHILREAKLYRETLQELMKERKICPERLRNVEDFWNRIMMEHALFIRGLLDPTEKKLIKTANEFAMDFKELLETARNQDCQVLEENTRNQDCRMSVRNTRKQDYRNSEENSLREKSLEETRKLRDFKEAGTKGILDCKISSIMLPLLADHVLREANHYIRLLECGYQFMI